MIAIAASLLAASTYSMAAKPPDTWDGLYRVKAKGGAIVYLLPQADFRTYSKVMLDPTEVAFANDWQRNNDIRSRLDDKQMRKILDEGSAMFGKSLAEAYTRQGYQVVTEAGPDVLRVRTGIANLTFVVPDQMSARSAVISRESGAATLVVEVRDSISGALLGRAIDNELAGEDAPYIRNEMTIRTDFEYLFKGWSKRVADGLDKLKANSPINTDGQPTR